MTDPTGSAGRGRLAEVLATRGGRAEPEAPFVIEHREALIYMLCQAAELEHGIMRQYLFAAFSLKQRTDEGLTPEELEAVTRWRHTIGHVATEEMLHLHVSRAPGGHGARRCERHRRARARGGALDGRRRHRAPAAGLRNRRPPVSLDRARSGAPR
jgi:hypothetical protein